MCGVLSRVPAAARCRPGDARPGAAPHHGALAPLQRGNQQPASDGVSCDIMFIMQEFDMDNYIDGMNDLPGLLCEKFLADSPNCQPGNVVDISHNTVTTALHINPQVMSR